MVYFIQNGLCTKWSLYEVTPVFLYEVVSFVRNGLCTKWSLYEMTANHHYLFLQLRSVTAGIRTPKTSACEADTLHHCAIASDLFTIDLSFDHPD